MSKTITLVDGSPADLDELDHDTLWRLQFEQEQTVADQIRMSKKGSPERAEVIGRGYDTVCQILAQMENGDAPLVMGLDARYVQLVLELLRERQFRRTGPARLFEIGYGSGAMLREVVAQGFAVAGIEVSQTVRSQALHRVPSEYHPHLRLGCFTGHELDDVSPDFDVIYWNDVFEHVPPDEIADYLDRAFELLCPDGVLVTITPNWHERPSDVTGDFCPPRTEAAGLHLREYTLRDVTRLLRDAGFARVETPLCVLPRRIVRGLGGLAPLKRWSEPVLEYLPFKLTCLLSHGLGLSYTLAHKG